MSNKQTAAIGTLPADQAPVLRTIFEWKYGGRETGRIRLPHPDFPDEFKVRSPYKYTDKDVIDHVETCAVFMPATWSHLIKAELLPTMGTVLLEALVMLEAKGLVTTEKAAYPDTGQLWKLPDGRTIDANVTVENGVRTITVSVDGTFTVEVRGKAGDELERYELSPEAIAVAEQPDPDTSMVGMFLLSDAVVMLFPDVSEPGTSKLRRRLGDWLEKHEDDIPQHQGPRQRHVRLDILKGCCDDFLREDNKAAEIVQLARIAAKDARELAKKIHRSNLD